MEIGSISKLYCKSRSLSIEGGDFPLFSITIESYPVIHISPNNSSIMLCCRFGMVGDKTSIKMSCRFGVEGKV